MNGPKTKAKASSQYKKILDKPVSRREFFAMMFVTTLGLAGVMDRLKNLHALADTNYNLSTQNYGDDLYGGIE
jgi:hypothetical protein